MLPSNKPPWELILGGLICKNDILGGGLLGGVGLFEDLRYVEIRMYIDLPIHNKEWVVLNFGKNILAFDFSEIVIDMVKMETSYRLMIYVEKFTYWLRTGCGPVYLRADLVLTY